LDFIKIDGSIGEGGGQILRTSLSLSIITGKPFEIVNIRASRRNPGLRPQHLASVHSAVRISSAYSEGAELGSIRLKFIPKKVVSGDYEFDVGTAGATSLVLQTIFFPLAVGGKSVSVLTIRGGTHVPWSPPYEFLEEGWFPFMKRMGFKTEIELKRAGFYPRGGGEIISYIEPIGVVFPLEIKERGDLIKVFGTSAVGGLPKEVAERGKNRVIQILRENKIPNQVGVVEFPSYGRGAIVFLKAVFEKTTVCHSALGEIGKRMEEVAEEACQKLIIFLKSDATVDENMADQLILPLALARGKSSFRTAKITEHIKTNAEVVKRFLDEVKIEIEGNEVLVEGDAS
jgi:RNA 3'-terminal phosphate cyclase (ATP)